MEHLLEQERQARLDKDELAMTNIISQILSSCKDESEQLTYLRLLSRRKGQLHISFKQNVNHLYKSKMQSGLDKKSLMIFLKKLLIDIVEGKFYLEEERIEITNILKVMYEEDGDDLESLNITFNVPVETFSIAEDIKIGYQLEILRLCVKNNDWIKCDIISKRIRKSYFNESGNKELEIKYLLYMVGVCLGQKNYNDGCNYFKKLHEKDLKEKTKNIVFCTFFTILSDECEERKKMLEFCNDSKDNTFDARRLIRLFRSNEIITKDVCEKILCMDDQFMHLKSDFMNSINDHNFKIVSKIFTSIKLDDLQQIMQCSKEDCVSLICNNVNRQRIDAKINQETGIVSFGTKKNENIEEKIEKVMGRLIKVNHLIQKENLKIGK
ncbi:proteasome regulatory particle subunit [Conglomerata obtusa]